MRRRLQRAIAVLALLPATVLPVPAADHVVIATDWRAEAEHGGLYAAEAAGLYQAAGLDVEIRQGGPSLNQAQMLAAGRVDFTIQSNSFEPLNFVEAGVPIVVVAAAFQKDPQVLMAHPGAGNDSLPQMRGKPVMISAASRNNFWQFLKQRYGFADDQIRPYNYSLAPFLANPAAIQQGYVTSEPFAVEQATHQAPVVILLADQGYDGYAAMIATTAATVASRPELVRRFVGASMAGWKRYLEGDPAAADALILKENPEMTPALLAAARGAIIAHGLVASGDAQTLGIGAMTETRWQRFADFARQAGLYPKTLDWRKAVDLRFVKELPKP